MFGARCFGALRFAGRICALPVSYLQHCPKMSLACVFRVCFAGCFADYFVQFHAFIAEVPRSLLLRPKRCRAG